MLLRTIILPTRLLKVVSALPSGYLAILRHSCGWIRPEATLAVEEDVEAVAAGAQEMPLLLVMRPLAETPAEMGELGALAAQTGMRRRPRSIQR